jgi:two-component system, response regulator PdtaR
MSPFPLRSQPTSPREDSAGPDKRPKPPARILVVEDEFILASQIEVALYDAGFHVTGVATSGEEAIALARMENPALILMDLRLAGKHDGIEAALYIFQNLGLRCIFATAHNDQMTRDQVKPAMPLGWLEKPYSMTSLVDTIRHALRELDGNR